MAANPNYATRKDIDEVIGIVRGFMQQVAERFDQQDERFDEQAAQLFAINNRMQAFEQRMEHIEAQYQQLLGTIDTFLKPLTSTG